MYSLISQKCSFSNPINLPFFKSGLSPDTMIYLYDACLPMLLVVTENNV